MATIDIGPACIDRQSAKAVNYTWICVDNPAEEDGVLDTFEIWAASDVSGCKVGTFYGSSTSYTSRDYESIGSVTYGSKQTFTGKNCDVSSGDYLGSFVTDGGIEASLTGYGGLYGKSGDQFGTGAQTYTLISGDAQSIYATGATAAAGNPYYYYLQQ